MCLKETEFAVLDFARRQKRVTRPILARQLRMSLPTVSLTVNRLLKRGLLVHEGRLESTGGRCTDTLKISPGYLHAIGMHINKVGVSGVITDNGGEQIERLSLAWESDDTDDRISKILEVAAGLVELAGTRRLKCEIEGIGIGLAGLIDHSAGVFIGGQVLPQARNIPLASLVAERTGLPARLFTATAGRAMAEYRFGNVAALCELPRDVLYCYSGASGLRMAIIADGHIVSGSMGNAGGFGHMSVYRAGLGEAASSLDDISAPDAMLECARAGGWTPGELIDPPSSWPLMRNLFRDAEEGVPAAVCAVERAVNPLAAAIADVCAIFEPGAIVLGGALIYAPAAMVECVRERVASRHGAADKSEIAVVRGKDFGIEQCAVGSGNMIFETQLPRALIVR